MRYINEQGKAAPAYLTDNEGRRVYHPTEAMLEAAGYHKVVSEPYQPTEAEVAKQTRLARIGELRELLASTDYKVIKNSECQMLGLALPYDPAEVHAEKQAWRDELNELEGGAGDD